MQIQSNNFIDLAEIAIHDGAVPLAVSTGTRTAYGNRLRAMFAESDEHGQAMRQQAAEAKRRALRHLPDLLEQAESTLTENGFTVLWAEDGAEACKHVIDIARQHDVNSIAKSKSMATEEIALNHSLEAAGLNVLETDLGEYILQLNNETPSHIVSPVVHMSKAEIKAVFEREIEMPPEIDAAEDIVAYARKKLRDGFLNADMGITGGNFVIAETGSISLTMNEGNGRMVTALPRVHVAVIGIEKVIADLDDYATLTQVLPRSGTGQKLTVYTNIINGPCDDGGPEHLYVIFLDNGRSRVYATDYAEALACIRCGACLNACPVYRSTGGHAYGAVYAGPIGAVLTPLFEGLDNAKPLPHASSLCGSCKYVCPVDIDIPRMLLDLRNDLVEERKSGLKWDVGIKAWEIGNRSPGLFELGGKAAKIAVNSGADRIVPGPLGDWRKHRDFPGFAPKPFRQLWRERQKKQG